MRDRYFFPLILMIAGAMIFFSLRVGGSALPSGPWSGGGSDYQTLTLEGVQLARIVAGGDADIDIVGTGNDAIVRIEALAGMLPEDPILGPHYPIAADLETAFSGHTIRITVRAKPGPRRGAQQFQVNYSTGKLGESGWQTFDQALESQDFTFEYDVPVHRGDPALDYLGIRPVVPDKTRTVDVEQITIQRVRLWAKDNS